jgi:hypothetical protein
MTLLVSFSLVLDACRVWPFPECKKVCESAVSNFSRQYNDGKYWEIYGQATRNFQNTWGGNAIGKFQEIERRLGARSQAQLRSMYVDYGRGNTMATLIYDTDFYRGGRQTETFQFDVSGEKANLNYYNIGVPRARIRF